MLVNELQNRLDGMDRLGQFTKRFKDEMAKSRLVTVLCPDDRTVHIHGAVEGQFRIGRGFVVTEKGIVPSEADDDYGFVRAIRNADRSDYGPVPLSFETNTDHETFTVMDKDHVFCIGIVFQLGDAQQRDYIWEGE